MNRYTYGIVFSLTFLRITLANVPENILVNVLESIFANVPENIPYALDNILGNILTTACFPRNCGLKKRSLRSRCFRSRTTELFTILLPVSTHTISFLLILITNDKSKLDMFNDPKCPKVSN